MPDRAQCRVNKAYLNDYLPAGRHVWSGQLQNRRSCSDGHGYEVVRGLGWQRGQKKLDRFMKCSRNINVPHRRHGRPTCP